MHGIGLGSNDRDRRGKKEREIKGMQSFTLNSNFLEAQILNSDVFDI